MRIQRICIDAFGTLKEQDVPGISPGLAVFLGRNEAGKSTLLRFMQAMFFGYRRNNRTLDPMPVRGKGGGRIFLHTEAYGDAVLERRPGAHGGLLSLARANGETLPESAHAVLFPGMSAEVYDSIFALNLETLMRVASLKGESVRHALHGAAFGAGLQSPAKVLEILDARMKDILKLRGAGTLNAAYAELTVVREEAAAAGNDAERFEALAARKEELEIRLAELNAERAAAAHALRRARRRPALWKLREPLAAVRAELSALAGEKPLREFAPDALQRLEGLLSRQEERSLALQTEQTALRRLEEEKNILRASISPAFADPALPELLEQREPRRQESCAVAELAARIQSIAGTRKDLLLRLGGGVRHDSALAADTSVFAAESLRESGRGAIAAERAFAEARKEEERLGLEAREAFEAAEESRRMVEERGAPAGGAEAVTPEEERAAADAVAALRAAVEALPRAMLQAEQRRRAFEDALRGLHPGWTRADLDAADISAESVRNLLCIADGAKETERRFEEAKRSRRDAEDRLARVEDELSSAVREWEAFAALPDEAELDRRSVLIGRLERETAAGKGKVFSPHPLPGGFALADGVGALFALAFWGFCSSLPASLFFGSAGMLAIGVLLCLKLRERSAESSSAGGPSLREIASMAAAFAPPGAFADPAAPQAHEVEVLRISLLRDGRKAALREREEAEVRRLREAREAARREFLRADEAARAAGEAHASAKADEAAQARRMNFPPCSLGVTSRDMARGLEALAAQAATANDAEETAENLRGRITAALLVCGGISFFSARLPDLPFADKAALRLALFPPNDTEIGLVEAVVAAAEKTLSAARRAVEESRERQALQLLPAERAAVAERSAAAHGKARERRAAAERDLLAAQEHFTACLASCGLRSGLSFESALEALGLLREYQALHRESEEGRNNLETLRASLAAYNTLVREAALRVGSAPSAFGGRVPEEEFQESLRLVDSLGRLLREDEERMRRLEELERQLSARREGGEAAENALSSVRGALNELLRGADAEAFRADFARSAALADARRRERELLESIRLYALDGAEGELLGEDGLPLFFHTASEEDMAEEIATTEARLAELDDVHRRAAEERGMVSAREEALAAGGGSGPLRARAALLHDSVKELARDWSRLALAKGLLLEAKRRFETEGEAGVIRRAGNIFRSITNGEYAGIAADLGEESFAALHSGGERRDPEKALSQGTREQLYLALRLAYVRGHALKAEPLPMIMDEVLVNSDPERSEAAARVFAEFAGHNQILYYTCRPETAELLLAAGRSAADTPAPSLFTVENGKIRQSEAARFPDR